jgi:hypothetical protein
MKRVDLDGSLTKKAKGREYGIIKESERINEGFCNYHKLYLKLKFPAGDF